MKIIKSVIGLVFLIGCNELTKNSPVEFTSNAKLEDVYFEIKDIVEKKDFSVVFFSWGQASNDWYKIFSLDGKNWQKIEIRNGIVEGTDTTNFVIKDTTIKKPIDQKEGKDFLDKLIQLGVFTMLEEDEILDKCAVRDAFDASTFYIEIISGNKVRKLKYYDPNGRFQQCPNVKEWSDLLKIEKLFTEEW